jgi:predicted unusual protein kinase regulating ubiquinone biosynthesis (AarF/ABC1/UbiB family)
VAVKVQRPGIRNRVKRDLRLMYRLASLPDLIHLFGGTRTRDVIDEFATWLDDELDYVTEAMNASPFGRTPGSIRSSTTRGFGLSIRQSV